MPPSVIKIGHFQLTEIGIQFWLLITAIVGFFATCWQLRQDLISRKTQLLHEMYNELRQLDLKAMELVEKIKESKSKDNEAEYKAIVTEYLNYLEHLSLLINTGHIDEDLAKRAFRKIIIEDAPQNFGEEIDDNIYKEYAELRKRWIKDKK